MGGFSAPKGIVFFPTDDDQTAAFGESERFSAPKEGSSSQLTDYV
jgi:hypothetical protein